MSCALGALRPDSTLSTGGKDAAMLIQGILSSGEPK